MKLAIGPAWASPFVWSRFTESALNLKHPEGYDVKWIFGQGWCPARRHTDLCEKALDWGADLICFAGADQVYPPDGLVRLVQRFQEGYEVISAMVPARGYFSWNKEMRPFQPMAWRFKPTPIDERGRAKIRPYRGQKLDGDMVEVVVPDGTVQPVDFIGSGFLLFHREHLLSLKRPWFTESVNPVTYQRWASMDTYFVWRLKMEALANVWVDTSIKITHLHPFAIDETFSERFSDWASPGVGDPDIARFEKVT